MTVRRRASLAARAAILAAAAGGTAFGAAGGGAAVTLSTATPRQGDPVVIRCVVPVPPDNVTIEWRGRVVPMKEEAPGRHLGLIGVDLEEPAGTARLAVRVARGAAREEYAREITVVAREFPVQRLTLPPSGAEFDNDTLARIAAERQALDERLSRLSEPVLWELPLVPPVAAWRPKGFGARRIINGEPRSPHAGVDVSAPEGTPVRAAAAGTVVLAAEQFFGGKSVLVDHGGGLFSLYYHLRDFAVKEGQRVRRGETIGSVGSTGRAVGAHLHFGVRAAGGRIDPAALFGDTR